MHRTGARRCGCSTKLCSAVEYAHARLIIHRDLKPSNVLVDDHGHPRLLDFGLAFTTDEAVPDRRMTPGYASPEQRDGGEITTSSDIYQLGLILQDLLADLSVRAGRFRSRLVHRDLLSICDKATRQLPKDRYPSVSDIRTDLARALSGRPLMSQSADMRHVLVHFLSRNAVTSFLAIVAVAAMASMLAIFTYRLAAERDIARQNEKRATDVLSFLVKTLSQADPFMVEAPSSSPSEAAPPLTVAAAMDRAVQSLLDPGDMNVADRSMLKATLGSVLYSLGEPQRCLSLVGGATDAFPTHAADNFLSAYLLSVEAECAFAAGDLDTARRAADLVVNTQATQSDLARERLGRSLLIRGLVESRSGDVAMSTKTFSDAREFSVRYALPTLEAQALRYLAGNALTLRSPDAPALAADALRAVERYAGRNSPWWIQASQHLSLALSYSGDMAGAERILTDVDAVVAANDEASGFKIPTRVRVELANGWSTLYYRTGRYAECAKKGHDALSLMPDITAFGVEAYNVAFRTAGCEANLEHWDEAESLYSASLDIIEQHVKDNPVIKANTLAFRAYAQSRQGRLASARESVDQAMHLTAAASHPNPVATLQLLLVDAILSKAEGREMRASALKHAVDTAVAMAFDESAIPPFVRDRRSDLD